MIISAIVAVSDNGVIGKDGKMPWRLPDESAYFKRTTVGHPIITGRKNFEAMRRPLPDRLNVIVTRQPDYKAPEGAVVAHSIDEALNLPEVRAAEEVFIIGGQQIYEEIMPKVDRLYLTKVHTAIDGGTAFFHYDPNEWRLVRSEERQADDDNPYAFTIQLLERKARN
ncbi:MAG TPA: dihydrofolate reductase [Candidatus Saccharimonadales bacterium]|nr:dihydrofolate reductase [Candidatus Saccharimonadales bacterium]